MNNSVVLSNWSIDAFDCLSSKLLKQLSTELISRVETFVSSVILFDQVVLSENYRKNRIVVELNKRHPSLVKIVSHEQLFHSTDMTKHISIERDLYDVAFEDLAKENKIWQMQHDPKIYQELLTSKHIQEVHQELLDAKHDFEMFQGILNRKLPPKLLHGLFGSSMCKEFLSAKNDPDVFLKLLHRNNDPAFYDELLKSSFLTELRLWHWCYTNEMAELTDSVNMLPLSLNAVGEKALKKKEKTDAVLKKYFDYANYHKQKYIRFCDAMEVPFISEIKSIPPLMTLLLTRCKSSEDLVHVLSEMRSEFKEFRKLRHEFTNKVQVANNLGEKIEVVADWNRSWEQLSAGEFKEPDFLKRKISSTDFASTIVSTKTGWIKSLITHALEHHNYKKSYKQFQVFANLEEHINCISQNSTVLDKVFGVEGVVHLN